MKSNPDESKLVDAILTDEAWTSCSARLQDQALVSLRLAKRRRAQWMACAQVAALLALFGGIAWNFRGAREIPGSQQYLASLNSSSAGLSSEVPRNEDTSRSSHGAPYITEEQMLALFPAGSCVVAEVNGQRQLVFIGASSEEHASPSNN